MLKQLSTALAIILLTACGNNKQEVSIQQELTKDTTLKATPIMFAAPLLIDSSSMIIYPLLFERTTGRSYVTSEYSSGGETTNYWNLLFYNTETTQQHLLTMDKKILIYSVNYELPSSSSSSMETGSNGINVFKNNIFYTVISKDFNTDDQLDEDDPLYLYVSDREGKGFRQLSPTDYHITSWQVVNGTTKIIMQGQKDSNGNKKFDANDSSIPLIVDIASMQPAKETFSNQYMDTLKLNMRAIWKAGK